MSNEKDVSKELTEAVNKVLSRRDAVKKAGSIAAGAAIAFLGLGIAGVQHSAEACPGCGGCTWTCRGGCRDECTGCYGTCYGSCTGSCTGCTDTCSDDCEGSCYSWCETACEGGCTGTCNTGCFETCYGSSK
jgi:modification target Cys-rich repeat protein